MKKLISLVAALLVCVVAYAQDSDFDYVFLNNGSVVKGIIENEVENVSVTIRATNGEVYTYKAVEVRKVAHGKAPKTPEVKKPSGSHVDYTKNETGFWFAAELQGGVTVRPNKHNMQFGELDVVAGYRISDYVRVGVGIGGRYYGGNHDFRANSGEFSVPIYANVRGNFIPTEYRKVVPYYSFDLGGALRDGVFLRPTIGLRIGEPRAAFLIGISYLGQSTKMWKDDATKPTKEDKFFSGVSLKIGYEF